MQPVFINVCVSFVPSPHLHKQESSESRGRLVSPLTPFLWWTHDTLHTARQNGSGSPSHSRGRHPWEGRDNMRTRWWRNCWLRVSRGPSDVQFELLRRSLLADVFPGQHFAAGLALKAAQMPLPVQREEGLSVLYVSATSCAIFETQKGNEKKKTKKKQENARSLQI